MKISLFSQFELQKCLKLSSKIWKILNLHQKVSYFLLWQSFTQQQILKKFTQQGHNNFLQLLTNHRLFAYIFDVVQMIDPYEKPQNRGKYLFDGSQQTGISFLRLLSQCLMFWSENFTFNKNGSPTQYKNAYDALVNKGIQFPSKYQYFSNVQTFKERQNRLRSDNFNQKQSEIKNQMSATIQSSAKGIIKPITKIEKQLNRTFNQIKKFVKQNVEWIRVTQKSNKAVNGEKLDEKIKDLHQFLQLKRQQYGQISDDVLSQKAQTVQLFYLLNDFFNAQRMHYRFRYQSQIHTIGNVRGLQYMTQIQSSYNDIFKKKVDFKERSKKDQVQITLPLQAEILSDIENLGSFAPKMSNANNFKHGESSINESQMNFLKQNLPSLPNLKDSSVNNSLRNSCGSLMGSKIFQNSSQIRNRVNGFQSYKRLLQNQIRTSPEVSRNMRSASQKIFHSQFTNSSFNKNQLSSQKKTSYSSRFFNGKMLNLFNSPPNPSLPPKQYHGARVCYDKQFIQQIYALDRGQDIRKFRLSNLKDKSVIYQNQHIQIGFHMNKQPKDSPKFGIFQNYLKIHLYFGNKSQTIIEKFSIRNSNLQKIVELKTTLFYTYPNPIKDIINQKTQNKVDLVFVALDFPYKIPSFIINYEINGYHYSAKIILPISMNKFVDYYPLQADFYSQAHQIFRKQTDKLYKVQNFRLSSHVHPLHIQKFIPELDIISTDNSTYNKFLQNGSTTDFQQICRIKINNQYNAILKIIIRPNLEVVLQGFLDQPSIQFRKQKQGQQRLKFYLYNLMIILSHW